MRTQVDNAGPQRQRPWSGRAASEGPVHLLKAMDELDSLEHMPEGLNRATWERFCLSRRTKVESEQQVGTLCWNALQCTYSGVSAHAVSTIILRHLPVPGISHV